MKCAISCLLSFCVFGVFSADVKPELPLKDVYYHDPKYDELYAIRDKFDEDAQAEIKVTDPAAKDFAVWKSANACIDIGGSKVWNDLTLARQECKKCYEEATKYEYPEAHPKWNQLGPHLRYPVSLRDYGGAPENEDTEGGIKITDSAAEHSTLWINNGGSPEKGDTKAHPAWDQLGPHLRYPVTLRNYEGAPENEDTEVDSDRQQLGPVFRYPGLIKATGPVAKDPALWHDYEGAHESKNIEKAKKCCKVAADNYAKKAKSYLPTVKACIEKCVKQGGFNDKEYEQLENSISR